MRHRIWIGLLSQAWCVVDSGEQYMATSSVAVPEPVYGEHVVEQTPEAVLAHVSGFPGSGEHFVEFVPGPALDNHRLGKNIS